MGYHTPLHSVDTPEGQSQSLLFPPEVDGRPKECDQRIKHFYSQFPIGYIALLLSVINISTPSSVPIDTPQHFKISLSSARKYLQLIRWRGYELVQRSPSPNQLKVLRWNSMLISGSALLVIKIKEMSRNNPIFNQVKGISNEKKITKFTWTWLWVIDSCYIMQMNFDHLCLVIEKHLEFGTFEPLQILPRYLQRAAG